MPSIHLALAAGLRAAGFLLGRRLAFTAAMLILGDSIRADGVNIHLGVLALNSMNLETFTDAS